MSDPLARYINQPEPGHRNEESATGGRHDEDGPVAPSLGPAQSAQHQAPHQQQSHAGQPSFGDQPEFNPPVPHTGPPRPERYGQYAAAPPQYAPQVAAHAQQGYQQQYHEHQQQQPHFDPESTAQFYNGRPVDPLQQRHRAAMEMSSVVVRPSGKLRPEKGWRRWLYLLTRINMGLSPDEVYERELFESIRKVVTPPRGTAEGFYVAVLSLKGGVGKTTLTMLLGSVFAIVRGAAALAVDADPDAGNLITRARKQTEKTVAQLVASADQLSGAIAVREMTNQNEANLEVLAGEDYVDAQRPFSADDWRTVKEVVHKYYSIVLADCGTGLHTDAARAVLDSAWAVVLLCDACVDSARAAALAVDWLRGHGYMDLAGRVVIVVDHTKPGKSPANLEEIKAKLAAQVGEDRVFEMPFDSHIETGGEIDIRLISPEVRRRATEICARLSEWFDKPRRV
ncbi:MinD/ParA family ATP-binding protein [Mycolicibacterium fortuitum]|uniref:AAA family ATPase n=1 Tax=Mycolicibacterium fortuitum TaxID=1766 RepID=A0AAE4VCX1_MYCFO|nr:MinD/ParA family protein [Mycolicibacterium fortuitum]MCV7137701.1 AAA family ATPase [Mycolicibacterium fortuitum]MDV7193284.1 AAA family ATPase [Mycolicibacterium fortuitum]MDV7206036.1 AAA family ATPase [Mycolicibacterium fortuitum]MDV7227448.1 AAA family ATPase [Mycolicibacterium fortuitum]MDV7259854.1 AAA family ATPase [Mycolicibacterium fortuitum]